MIIPAFNEEDSIKDTVTQVQGFRNSDKYELDYVVINDGSTDETEAVCRKNGFTCINLVQNLGIGGAVQCGYIYAYMNHYDIAVQFDGDGQHDISYLDRLVEPILCGQADFVIGSRFIGDTSSFKSTFLRRIGIRYLATFISLVTKRKITDPTSGFRASNLKVTKYFAYSYPSDYPEPESTVQLSYKGFRIKEVPVNMFERQNGKSSISIGKSIYYLFKVSLAILCTGFQRKDY